MFFNKKREVIFFRHGETNWNKAGLVQGRTDIYLNPEGILQADRLGRKLKGEDVDFVISSPLRRAKTTAKIVLDVLDKPHNLKCSSALVERDFGVVEGRKFDEILVEYKEIFDIMDDDTHPECLHATFPNGESKYEVLTRVMNYACNFMNSNAQYKKVAVSCHGGILRYINLFINKQIAGYGNCDYIKVNLKDLEAYNKKLVGLCEK
ncbi:MAG TPA: alpha-ribazole phosphatase [Alphaproteobacteria bacterium]|nr:alpha-ribazole phosphatase [Alphaproteobacteria bacterium]